MTEREELLKLRTLLAEKEQVDGQLSLFESVQELARELFGEQKKITVNSYEKTPRKSGVREEMLSGLPKDIEEYMIHLTSE